MDILPDDVLGVIAKFLRFHDMIHFGATELRIKNIVNKYLLKSEYSFIHIKKETIDTLSNEYIFRYSIIPQPSVPHNIEHNVEHNIEHTDLRFPPLGFKSTSLTSKSKCSETHKFMFHMASDGPTVSLSIKDNVVNNMIVNNSEFILNLADLWIDTKIVDINLFTKTVIKLVKVFYPEFDPFIPMQNVSVTRTKNYDRVTSLVITKENKESIKKMIDKIDELSDTFSKLYLQ